MLATEFRPSRLVFDAMGVNTITHSYDPRQSPQRDFVSHFAVGTAGPGATGGWPLRDPSDRPGSVRVTSDEYRLQLIGRGHDELEWLLKLRGGEI